MHDTQNTKAIDDVIRERIRQRSILNWSEEHDDQYVHGELAQAAVCYADYMDRSSAAPPKKWPWDYKWWNPGERRRELVKATALLIAEIERIDRAMTDKGENCETS